jgi:dienelactone hydrolase
MDAPLELVRLPSRDGRPMKALLAEGDLGAPGVVILHGYGSRKDNHVDFAARLAALGMWVLIPDLRGHGGTPGPMDEGMIGDVLASLDDLTYRGAGALGMRGSSMGGFLALTCAPMHQDVRAVVAICPARPESLAMRLGEDWPLRHPLGPSTWRHDGIARGFWHATGDDVVPWGVTYELWSRASQPKHLRIEMGGHHQSLQHDPAGQQATATFLAEHMGATPR